MARPTMIFPYLSDRRVGDGHRPAFVLSAGSETATLFVHSKLVTLTVPRSTMEKARVISYKPAQVRANILEKARYFRQHGKRFPRQPTGLERGRKHPSAVLASAACRLFEHRQP